MAEFADEVDGAGGDDKAVGWGDLTGLGEGAGEVRGGVGGDVERVGGGERGLRREAARGLSMGAKMMWSWARRAMPSGWSRRAGGGSGHLGEALVAQAAEDEGAGAGLGELRDGGAEGPGAGGVVGYVEQDLGLVPGRSSRRPGQRVLRMPASMAAFVML